MNIDKVTNYTNQTPSKHFGRKKCLSLTPLKNEMLHEMCKIGCAHLQYVNNLFQLQRIVEPGSTLPDGYILLAPGATVAVESLWLHSVIASTKGKTNKKKGKLEALIIKRLLKAFLFYR